MLDLTNIPKVKVGVPPAFQERVVLRALKPKFGNNSNNKPMITTNWEVVGYFDSDGNLKTSIKRGDVEYKLAGLQTSPAWFTLAEKSLGFYFNPDGSGFWNKANPGEILTELDETDPDLDYFEDLFMQAVVSGSQNPMRRQLTEEEKQEKIAKGEKPIGDILKDENGNDIENPVLQIKMWLGKYTGAIPEEVETPA